MVKTILQRYESLLGKAINLNKSSVVFSLNTMVSNRRQVCATLQVNEVSTPGNYLGLPMYIG